MFSTDLNAGQIWTLEISWWIYGFPRKSDSIFLPSKGFKRIYPNFYSKPTSK